MFHVEHRAQNMFHVEHCISPSPCNQGEGWGEGAAAKRRGSSSQCSTWNIARTMFHVEHFSRAREVSKSPGSARRATGGVQIVRPGLPILPHHEILRFDPSACEPARLTAQHRIVQHPPASGTIRLNNQGGALPPCSGRCATRRFIFHSGPGKNRSTVTRA
jgi:hypothetical protein